MKFKHPIEKHEDELKSRIAALDRHFAKGGMKLSPKRHTREVLQCTLEQCIDFRATSIAYINSLELAIEKYHQKISDVKNGVITWSRYVFAPPPLQITSSTTSLIFLIIDRRFSRQYQDLLNVCLDTLEKCSSGARLLKVTYTNGSPRTYSNDVNAVWAGFGDSTFSFAGYDAELNVRVALPISSLPSSTPNNLRSGSCHQALDGGDNVAVDDAFSGTNLNGRTLTAFPARTLKSHSRSRPPCQCRVVVSGVV